MEDSLASSFVEEFTDDFLYDKKRDTFLAVVQSQYRIEVHKIMHQLGYMLALAHFNQHNDTYTLVFI